MTDLLILHPDNALRSAMARTIATLWNGQVTAADPAKQEIAADNVLRVSLEKPIEGSDSCIAFSNAPPRLQDIVWQLENAAARLRWPKEITVGKAYLDTATREWRVGAETIELTEKEVSLLVHLSQAKAPVSRASLLRDVWRYASDAETHTVETHIHRLRQKIENNPEEPVFLLTTKEGYTLPD